MYIYEVSLQIELDIYEAYRAYLDRHIPEVVECSGFLKADILVATEISDGIQLVRVLYHANALDTIHQYFEQHAAVMRADALKHFPSGFSASRQVYCYEQY